MIKIFIKIILILFIVNVKANDKLICGTIPLSFGSCGDNCEWNYNHNTKTLDRLETKRGFSNFRTKLATVSGEYRITQFLISNETIELFRWQRNGLIRFWWKPFGQKAKNSNNQTQKSQNSNNQTHQSQNSNNLSNNTFF